MKIEELSPYSKGVNVRARVLEKENEREVVSSRDGAIHRVSNVLVGDETGTIYMTLWDADIDRVSVGDTIEVKNGFVSLFRGSMRLNVGRFGSLEQSESEIAEEDINRENNLSEKQYSVDYSMRRYSGRGYRGPRGRGRRSRG